MPGPTTEVTSNLFSVFVRWREEEVAITADIQDLFLRAGIPKH